MPDDSPSSVPKLSSDNSAVVNSSPQTDRPVGDGEVTEYRFTGEESTVGDVRRGGQWLVVAFALFVVAWGGNEFTPMMVFYRGEHVFGKVFVDSLLASYAAGIVVGLLLMGPLSDRFGRRVVMLPAPVVGLLASVFIAMGEMNEPLIFIGRVLSGLSIGMAMTAGGAWIKELSVDNPAAGAKRSTMSLTAGFAVGAVCAGVLAQWGPAPGQTPYIVHIVLSVLASVWVLRVPETRQGAYVGRSGAKRTRVGVLSALATPRAVHPRFLFAIVPIAPWVFGCAGVAYAIMPARVQSHVNAPVAFSALVTMICLGVGFAVQQFSARYTSPKDARGQQLGLVLVIVGMSIAVWAAVAESILGVVLVAVVLGAAYGVCLISGLGEVQRLAGPEDLGALTAIFYSVTYVGFFFPMILTRLSQWFTYPVMLGFGVVMAVLALTVVSAVSRRFVV